MKNNKQIVRLSERSTVVSSNNSFDIQIYLLLIIVYECTEKQSSTPFNKLSFIFSSYINDISVDLGIKTKDLIPSWPICDLKKHIIYGDVNQMWEVKIKSGKIWLSRTKQTMKIYSDIIDNEVFGDALVKIRKLSSVSTSKIDRQRLV